MTSIEILLETRPTRITYADGTAALIYSESENLSVDTLDEAFECINQLREHYWKELNTGEMRIVRRMDIG